ncbi:phosphotransferase, partial [Turicimonas muris]
MECREQLNKWLALVSPTYGLQPETLTYASSDAGFRQYFRIQGTGRSYIIMDCPKEKQSMKEFVKVDKIMKTAGLNVPEIFEVDFEGGFMLLSDLGTKTYLDVLDHDNADRL